ncbi:alpha-amylase [Rhizosphaericola mali]|uniref:Alpha-amylase n=1 Tax=Rhizosphaericola mali TaxID=2545455 RepID=A0A5P2G7T0_9BACT|nr:alpha-amylase [Rhizosphaericola mali]QES89982.1 alpha-amylase [Rhizosphaericola mali]
MKGTLLQSFHWYTEGEGKHWKKLKAQLDELKKWGITAMWLPPAYKSASGDVSVGYDVYDLFDLGEFDQKNSVVTKYGTKEEYLALTEKMHELHMEIYPDIVMNHKMGADEKEKVKVIKVEEEDRLKYDGEPFEAEIYTKFTFPGRDKKYSEFIWDFQCFTGIDYVAEPEQTGIFKILNQYGDNWQEEVDDENSNYDYLMGADIDFRNPNVVAELKYWGKWYYDTIHFDGVRLDALKHLPANHMVEWLDYIRAEVRPDCFAVGEYWTPEHETLVKYIDETEGKMHLFDVPLHDKFHEASEQGTDFDLSTLFDKTLIQSNPDNAVTLVANHDTQPLQALEAPVAPWFKPLAYAIILLRPFGYPCVFYPDVYGAEYVDKGEDGNDHQITMPKIDCLPKLLEARQQFVSGEYVEFFDHPNCVAWWNKGENEENGSIVILSNGEDGFKDISLGENYVHQVFVDYLGNVEEEVTVGDDGMARFLTKGGSVSVWIRKK